MASLEAVEKVKVAGFVDSGYNRKNQARIKAEEEELEKLVNGTSEVKESKAEDEVKEEVPEVPLTKEEESFKKRYGDLRRHVQQKEKEWEDRFNELESQLKNGTPLTPPKSREDVEDWIRKHPDVAAIVQALAAEEAEKRFSNAELRLQELDNERFELQRQKAEQAILKAHPDFNEIKVSDDFHNWAEEQPKWVQDAVYENADDPKSVVRVIDLYKVDMGMTKSAKKQADRSAASAIKTPTKPSFEEDEASSYFTESQVAKMSDKEYEKNQDKILEAMRSGKFRYDLSGGAR
jgi:hypothetical protein